MDTPQQSVEYFITQFLEAKNYSEVSGHYVRQTFSEAFVLQRHYNRLYVMDMNKTLKAGLPQENATFTFKEAAMSIWTQQQAEMAYLISYHPALKSTLLHLLVAAPTLKVLEARHAALNEINKKIIIKSIGIHSFLMDLKAAHITRFSLKFFEEKEYADIIKNCRNLDLGQNQITMLDLHEFKKLQHLWCDQNKIVALNVANLDMLEVLDCSSNLISILNLRGCSSLNKLDLKGNPLNSLTLAGTPMGIIEEFGDLELELLTQQLSLTKITCPMEIDTDDQTITQTTETTNLSEQEDNIEIEAPDFYHEGAPLYTPSYSNNTAVPILEETQAVKRKRTPDNEGPGNKKPKN